MSASALTENRCRAGPGRAAGPDRRAGRPRDGCDRPASSATAPSSMTTSPRLADLPAGWTDRQDAGRYRLADRADDALFGYAVGPQSWKRFLHPPVERLWRAAPRSATSWPSTRRASRRALRLPRRARLRAGRRSPSRTGFSCDGAYVDPHYAARRAQTFLVAVNCGQAGGTCFCASMDTGPKRRRRLRSRADRAAGRRRHDFLAEIGTEPAPPRCSRYLPHAPGRPRPTGAAAAAVAARTAGQHGAAACDTEGLKDLLQGQSRASALGRGGGALPGLRQLHHGLPDLLLHHRRGPQRPRRPTAPSASGAGIPASPLDFSYVHGGSVRDPDAVALSPVDDPQAGALDRPVRHLRLRRLRPLHHLVPGRHRHHRRSRRHPASRSKQGRTSMETLESIVLAHPFFAGLDPEHRRADRRLRPQPSASSRAHYLFHEGDPADEFYLIRAGRRGAGDPRARRRRSLVLSTLARGRHRRRLVADAALSLELRCPRPRPRRAIGIDAACLRGKCEADPRSRLRDDEALRCRCWCAGCRRRRCSCSTSTGGRTRSRDSAHDRVDPYAAAALSRHRGAARHAGHGDARPAAGRRRHPRAGAGPVQHAVHASASARRRSASAATPIDGAPLVHTLRGVGAVSKAIIRLQPGEELGVRGPFGTAWPVAEADGHDVLFIAGGLGLAPLRPAIYHVLANRDRYGRVVVLYGARSAGGYPVPRGTGAVAAHARCAGRGHGGPRPSHLARRVSAW